MRSDKVRKKRYVLYFMLGQRWCAGCKKYMAYDECTLDHRKPRSKGGTLAYSNIQLMHYECNQKKGNTYEPAAEAC